MEERYTLRWSDNPRDALTWLEERGYRALLAANSLMVANAGVIFAKGPSGTVRMAKVGETLVYDGKTMKVESS
ncbi:hypothetical protein [Streptomyces sp. 6N106]|uniref:hypothetical protein n=1 Tax=Streptomyces sp. 6N106 TaxID=3457418 RepID=UPI003FD3344F